MIRVVIADDSPVVRAIVQSLLEADPDMSVVGVARNGAEALEMARRLRPDLLTMDVRMPVMDGIEATSAIMEEAPCPILVLADSVHDDTSVAFRAIQAGAIDVIQKPTGGLPGDYAQLDLVRHVRLVAGVLPIRRSRRRVTAQVVPSHAGAGRVVAMAASTGGPPALAAVLGAFPAELPCAILVVQHISHGFLQGFVDWLRPLVRLEVRIVERGDRLRPGVIHFAPEDRHLVLERDGRLVLSTDPPRDGHRPSATVLFESVAKSHGRDAVGVLLTGMGRDGAEGLRALRSAGGHAICQDEASSVIHGMPGAAIELGAADRVVPLDAVAEAIATALQSR